MGDNAHRSDHDRSSDTHPAHNRNQIGLFFEPSLGTDESRSENNSWVCDFVLEKEE